LEQSKRLSNSFSDSNSLLCSLNKYLELCRRLIHSAYVLSPELIISPIHRFCGFSAAEKLETKKSTTSLSEYLREVFSNNWDSIDALFCADPGLMNEFEEKPVVSESNEQSTSAKLVVSDAQTPKEWGSVLKEAAQFDAHQVFIWVKHAEQRPQVLQDVQTLVGFL